MFLESIKLHGFKAFAGRAEIKLHPGITGILGPNGCGKSNIADAIRWVLGEQSVKQLRGDSMEDVIFKGTRDRKPLGMAEVLLRINNERSVLGIDYDDVAVGRRLFRSGQSDYLLNKMPCRLKDIRSLFLDSGLGVQAYSIFERHMIDEILNDSSPKRRELFEEASGIMKYKVRKKEAMRKLDASNRDLERLTDLIAEIEREVRSLSRQVGRARRYRRLKEETRDLDVALGARLVKAADVRRRELQRELEHATGRETGFSAELGTGEADAERLRLRLLETADALSLARAHLAEEKDANAERTQRSEVLAERREGLLRAIDDLTREIDTEEARAAELVRELETSGGDVLRFAETASGKRADLEREESTAAELDARLRETREKQSALQQLTLELREEESEKRHELGRETTRLEEIVRRRERLESDRSESSARSEALVGRVEKRRAELAEVAERVREIAERLATLEATRAELDEGRERAREASRALDGELASATSRLETLEDLRSSFEGYEHGVRELLREPPDGVLGPLAECIDPGSTLTAAFEAALGAAAQSVVVRDAGVALACTSLLAEAGKARATFCPIVEMAERCPPRIDAPGRCLAEGVRLRRPEAAPVVEALLGGVFLVDSTNEARRASARYVDLTFVTSSGEAFHADRRISGGGPSIGGRLLSRGAEIDRVAERRAFLAREIARTAGELETFERNRESTEEALAGEREALNGIEARRSELGEAVRHLEFELELAREETRGLDAELGTLAEETSATETRICEREAAREAARREGEARGDEWGRLGTEMSSLEERREALQRAVTDRRVAFVEISAELRSAETHRARLEADRADAERVAGDRRRRMAEAREQIAAIESELAELAEKDATGRLAVREADAIVESLTNQEADSRNAWTERDRALRAVRENVANAREAMHELELELSSTSGDARALRDRLFQDYGVELVGDIDAQALPMVVRRERARPIDPGTDRHAIPEEGPNGNGEGGARTRLSIEALRSSAPGVALSAEDGAGVDTDPDTEVSGGERHGTGSVADIVVGPMPPDPPERYAGVEESEWPAIVADLRERLSGFGPVNEMAVEDFEVRQERLGFLTRQRDDLVEARNALLETIRKVNREARERFLTTFASAQKNFEILHEVLFPGGYAELQLQGDDPLEGDIVMAARPHGKRVESIKLLSSGERALTAIALLFSIYMIKPSPFCLLDEVDAPLDDANIDRFVRLIKQFADRTQFIVITHNKRTMEACDTLYGVTMQEPGVSSLVSVRFHDGEVVLDGGKRTELVSG